MIVGTRKEVFNGKAEITPGGNTRSMLDARGKSKKQVEAAKKRMKREGKKALVNVFKPKKNGSFKLQPPKGSAEYEKLIKKM